MNFIREVKKNRVLFIMTLPAVLCLIIFNYMPMFGVILAFKEYNYRKGILGSPFAFLKNFDFLFKTDAAFIMTRNTVLYNLVFIILTTIVLPVVTAVILSEIRNRILAKFYQTIIIMPYFLSWVVTSFIVFAFLSVDRGYINTVLTYIGVDPINWYSEARYWPIILILAQVWKNVGYMSIIYLASITGISSEYYEAAIIDGASKWQQAKSITIPSIRPMIMILVILAIGRIFYADFGLFYQVPRDSGQLYSVTTVIDTYVYTGLKTLQNIGMAAAANFYQSVVGFVLVLISNLIVRKIDKDYALF